MIPRYRRRAWADALKRDPITLIVLACMAAVLTAGVILK